MQNSLYEPFREFEFNYKRCFLTGKVVSAADRVQLIPTWLMTMANLSGDERIKLLDETIKRYADLQLPCDPDINRNSLNDLEETIGRAFSKGFDGIKDLEKKDLFNWIGKFLYGFVYLEMNGAIRQNQLQSDGINMGQGLMQKFSNLHTMIQGIHREVVLEDFFPFSIVIVPLQSSDTPFSFRDELNTLTFSMKFKDFGIIACLQDNGANTFFHQPLLNAIENKKLSEQQFEELSARFFYSAYLFNRLPEYTKLEVDGVVYISAMPLRGSNTKPLFDSWQHKTYGQVLENFWKPWNHTLFEIIKDPRSPMSYFEKPYLPVTE